MSGANTGEKEKLVFQNLCSVGLELNEASIHPLRVQKLQLKYWCRSVYFSQPGLKKILIFTVYECQMPTLEKREKVSFPELVTVGLNEGSISLSPASSETTTKVLVSVSLFQSTRAKKNSHFHCI